MVVTTTVGNYYHPMAIDIDKAEPLSRWLIGTLTLHFSRGTVVQRRVHLNDARHVQEVLAHERGGDALDWHALHWIQFEDSKVVHSSFEVDEDGGWRMDPDERDAVAKAGHRHGVLRSLVDYWASRRMPEPSYSLYALYELHRAAVSGMSRPDWETFARLTVGSEGARRLADVSRPAKVQADDSTAPEDAPDSDAANPTHPAPDDAEPGDVPPTPPANESDADGSGSDRW